MANRVIEMLKRRDRISEKEAREEWGSTIDEARSLIESGDTRLEDLLLCDGYDLDYMEDLIEALV